MAQNKSDSQRVLDYVNGALNYFGIIYDDEMFSIVRQHLPVELKKQEFDRIITKVLRDETQNYYFSRHKNILYNVGIDDLAFIINEQNSRPDIPYKPLTEKEALAAINLELQSGRDKYTAKIMRFLTSKGWTGNEVADQLFEIDLKLNNGAQHPDLIKGFLKEVDFAGEKELNRFVTMITDFLNNTPLWILKGWTPVEICSRFGTPSSNPLTDKPFRQTTLAEQNRVKVGRNDPCPCGSGKKYKKCCLVKDNESYIGKTPSAFVEPGQTEPEKHSTVKSAARTTSTGENRERKPALEEWSALYNAAIKFKAMQCWDWMYEDEIFGVRNPESDDIAYVSIMGTLGQVYALHAYRGAEGLISFFKIQESSQMDITDELEQIYFQQNSLTVSFENRGDLKKEDLEIIKKLNLKFRGKKQWPMFRSLLPGKLPWFINSEECRFLTLIIEQAMVVADKCRDNNDILIAKPGRLLVRTRQGKENQAKWVNSYIDIEKTASMYNTFSFGDDIAVRKFIKSAKRVKATWEADIFYSMMPIQENKDERPYLPAIFLIADSNTELIIKHELIKDITKDSYQCLEGLHSTIEQTGKIPNTMVVEKDATYYYLVDACKQLNIELKLVKKLKTIPQIRKELNRLGR
ncbi:MAG: SEC-C metal-binding domain-containing protein [Bacillota bacterium]|nr:SEC-C metal-binding domain-containing protein [Bacillota bacterium]